MTKLNFKEILNKVVFDFIPVINLKTIEIYELDYDENDIPKYYLWKTISEENKDELRLVHFPNIKITFEDLFDEIDY